MSFPVVDSYQSVARRARCPLDAPGKNGARPASMRPFGPSRRQRSAASPGVGVTSSGGAHRAQRAGAAVHRRTWWRLALDETLLLQLGERHVERDHALLLAGLHRRRDLMELALADQVPHRRRADQYLARGDAAAADLLPQALRYYRLEGLREHGANLALLAGREDVDDAVDRLRRARRVQGAEDEVSGLGRGERETDRLQVTHLTHENDVGVLAQRTPQRGAERRRVGADLALVHQAALRLVRELHRILDREDVTVPGGVDEVDHRRKCRRLARACRAGHEDEAALAFAEFGEDGRHVERFEGGYLRRDGAQHRAGTAALHEDVHAEAPDVGDGPGKVELALGGEVLALLRRQDRVDDRHDAGGVERRMIGYGEIAVDAQPRRPAGAEMQVRRPLLDRFPNQRFHSQHADPPFERARRARSAATDVPGGESTTVAPLLAARERLRSQLRRPSTGDRYRN